MKLNPIVLLTCGALLALPATVQAAPDFQKTGHGAEVVKAAGCPPGLAKKGNGCQPPGLAKQPQRDRDDNAYQNGYQDGHVDALRGYRIGDRIQRDYVVIERTARHGLDPNGTYYRVNGGVYQVDRQTREILGIIGLAARVLN
ncbi:excinuclease ABC subunit A [Pseudooceanicola lipolyticus]|uniref:excinuclease ABC subunit A n=1 Tax=Pseudooceanicola lipolyticus TaxID=2029104 RepID=UPI001F0BB8C4|nr:excinuclease ABC subunit A [Pseudooceanicola lipolyticus]